MNHSRKSFGKILLYVISWIFALIVIVPLVLMVVTSLKPNEEAVFFSLSLPKTWKFGNYINAFVNGNMLKGVVNSAIMSVSSAFLSNFVAAMAAYVITRNRTRLNKVLNGYFFLGVVATSNMVSTTYVMSKLNLMNSLFGTFLLLTAQGIAFSMLLYTGFVINIPKEIDEAAIVDGASPWTTFTKVIFPLLKPVTITGFVLNFMGAWNGFETQLYTLTDSNKWGTMLNMYSVYGQFSSPWNIDWGLICAYIVMTIIPVLVVYIFGQKYIIEGMTSGSVKG